MTAANSYRASCSRLLTLTAIFAQLLLNKFIIVKEDPPPGKPYVSTPVTTLSSPDPLSCFGLHMRLKIQRYLLPSCHPIIMYTLMHLSVMPLVLRVGRFLVETRSVHRLRKFLTGSRAQTSSFAMGTKVLSRTLSSRDAMLTGHLHLAQWLTFSRLMTCMYVVPHR